MNIKETYDTLGSLEAFENFVAANVTSEEIEAALGEEIEHEYSNYIYYMEK